MISAGGNPELLRIYIDGLPIRPSLEGIDYVQTIVDTRERTFQNIGEILKVKAIEAAGEELDTGDHGQ